MRQIKLPKITKKSSLHQGETNILYCSTGNSGNECSLLATVDLHVPDFPEVVVNSHSNDPQGNLKHVNCTGVKYVYDIVVS
jgi:hypothetical protein